MSVKINGKKLHLTTFVIPTTGKNLRLCLVAQKEFAKVDETIKNAKADDDQSIINSLDAYIDLIDTYTNFLKPILHLSDDQVKKVENADFNDVEEFANEIISKVLGVDSSKSQESADK